MRASRPSTRPSWRRARRRRRHTGRKPGGRPPAPPVAGPAPTDQVNLTDEDIAHHAGGGRRLRAGYNAQAAVASGQPAGGRQPMWCRRANDKQQIAPMLGKLAELPEELGKPEILLADNGYFSEANVEACAAAGIEPLIAMGRKRHHPSLAERFADHRRRRRSRRRSRRWPSSGRRRRARRATPCASRPPSRCSASSNRCSGFRQFLLRGLDKVAASGTS